MAEEAAKVLYEEQTTTNEEGAIMKPEEAQAAVESTDRGLFDFMKKDNKEDHQIASEFEAKVQVEECHKKHDQELVEKIHRSDSSSSSSSDEEEGDIKEEKKRKKKEKKGLKEKIKDKLQDHEETNVPIEKVHDEEYSIEPQVAEEKKGFLEKIKEKLPGQHKKADEDAHVGPTTTVTPVSADEPKEKKGFMDKIKDKIPGYHSKNATEE